MYRPVFLVGMPGAGKTTIGRKLAGVLNRPFVDLDEYLEKKEGVPIREIFAQQGEIYFRQAEASGPAGTGHPTPNRYCGYRRRGSVFSPEHGLYERNRYYCLLENRRWNIGRKADRARPGIPAVGSRKNKRTNKKLLN